MGKFRIRYGASTMINELKLSYHGEFLMARTDKNIFYVFKLAGQCNSGFESAAESTVGSDSNS